MELIVPDTYNISSKEFYSNIIEMKSQDIVHQNINNLIKDCRQFNVIN